MAFVFPIPETPSVKIVGEAARFAVRRIFCVGRNYAEHAREMGGNPDDEPPFFFTKPADALVADGATIPYPLLTRNLHYEGELVLAIGKAGTGIVQDKALEHVYGYACGNDLTRRDLQQDAKKQGLPWDWGKAFDNSAVCGPIHKASEVGAPARGALKTAVNGAVKQDSDLARMIWPVPDILAFLSAAVAIRPGDLVYTGTPAGVGPLAPGDVCVVSIAGLGSVTTTIARA